MTIDGAKHNCINFVPGCTGVYHHACNDQGYFLFCASGGSEPTDNPDGCAYMYGEYTQLDQMLSLHG